MKKKQYLYGGFFFLILFLFWTFLYFGHDLEDVDALVRTFFERHGTSFFHQCATVLSFFASWKFLVPFTIVLLFFVKKRKAQIYLVSILTYSTILAHLVKWIVKRERAIPFFGSVPKDYSYPSGHTMATLCFYGFLFLMFRKRVSNKVYRIIGQTFFILLFFFIPLSRLVLGVHYFSDVVASIFLAGFFLNMFLFFAKEMDEVLIENS